MPNKTGRRVKDMLGAFCGAKKKCQATGLDRRTHPTQFPGTDRENCKSKYISLLRLKLYQTGRIFTRKKTINFHFFQKFFPAAQYIFLIFRDFCKIFAPSWSNIVAMAENDEKSTAQPAHNDAIGDELLVKRFKAGDASAFDKIVEQYSTDVAILANRLLGWRGDVQDIVQDVFLAAFVAMKKFRSDSSLKTWLFTITMNKCRTHRYRHMLRLRFFSKAGFRISARTVPGADKTTMDNEKFSRIRGAVMALPAKYREPVVLRYLQELSTSQICQVLGISENNLHTRLSRAREQLKQSLAELIE